mmetsp:Transcript_22536/g.40681  ORF Transcript_22536/g.40681 Transcript_22536/m.40681 type:complete len:525 (-) Transcript_22536:64-1638(-)
MVSQGVGGHEGMSGTPLWKIREQHAAHREAAMAESLAYVAARSKPIIPPNVLVDGVSQGGGGGSKPLVRHVLVKDLRKVADRMKLEFPMTGLFENQSPIGLYALFDGQSSAGESGPMAAEYCAKNFHKKVMDNCSALPPNCTSETFVKAALVKSFEDLDKELLDTQPDILDGCGAAVALLIGDTLFTAVLGLCDGILYEVTGEQGQTKPLGRSQGRCHLQEERARLGRIPGATVVGNGPGSKVRTADGSVSSVSRSLGDRAWKGTSGGAAVLSCIPEVQGTKLSWSDKKPTPTSKRETRHVFFLLNSKPVAEAIDEQEMVDIAKEYPQQPRAATGELCTRAVEKAPGEQHTSVEVWLLPGGPTGGQDDAGTDEKVEPAKKKQKTGNDMTSARLRHIMIKFQDVPQKAPDGKKVGRSKSEAETLIRKLMRELHLDMVELRKTNKGRKPEEIALRSTKFLSLCKEHSECETSKRGGNMCGDLGWVSKDLQLKRGGNFRELVAALRPGDYSDVATSAEGMHLIQRIA